jgi:hypothetical protein
MGAEGAALGAGASGAATGASGASGGASGGGFDFAQIPALEPTTVGSLGPAFQPAGGGVLSNLLNGNFGEAATGAGQWAMNNPLRVAGLLQTGYGLLNKPQENKPYEARNLGSSKGGGGTNTGGLNQSPGNYWVNPYTLAQLQRTYGGAGT